MRGLSLSLPCAAFRVASVLTGLVALTAAFDGCQRRRARAATTFGAAFAIAIGIALGSMAAGKIVQAATGVDLVGAPADHQGIVRTASEGAFDGLLVLGLWAVAVVFPFSVRDANARAIEADRLRTAAELARLRAHLQPHFLMNTLNTVSGLVSEAPEDARRLIGALGDLLRDSLEDAEETQTIEAEVEWLQRYAEILETRHRGMLSFRWAIADATRGVNVPRLLLQPLVENAVKHGALRRREGAGEVVVTTSVDAERRVQCVVEDNGPGPSAKGARPGALGIQLVTRRLALRYAGAAAFRLETENGRTRSIVELPAELAR
jgi:signal transduction histidine kinase